MKKIDMIGKKFGKLLVVSECKERTKGNKIQYIVKCDCGKTKRTTGDSLRIKKSTNCGCYRIKHGGCGTYEYQVWRNMIARCHGKHAHKRYKGRGITVCEIWQNDFSKFLDDMGKAPKGYSIDRIDNDGNYEPNNCRWASHKKQMNNKSNNIKITYKGKRYNVQQLVDKAGIRRDTFIGRIKRGWSVKEAVEKPVDKFYARNIKCN